MKIIIAVFLSLTAMSANSECWIVGDLNGHSQFSPSYELKKDKAEGEYKLEIKGESASVERTDDNYNSGLQYYTTSPLTIIGSADNSALTETWTITGDHKVLYTKVRSSQSGVNQISSFVGRIKSEC